jgi:hypothetical protein
MFERWVDKPARMHWRRWQRIKRREAGYLAVTDAYLRAVAGAPGGAAVAAVAPAR